jgi:hypothetical protein
MTDTPDTPESSSAETEKTEHMIPKSRMDEISRKNKELQSQLQQLMDKQAQSDESTRKQRETELAEQNRYKELYEQSQAELITLRNLQTEVKRYRESFEATLQSRLSGIPEEKKHLVPEFDDPIKLSAWLDKALPDLVTPAKPNAPKLDGGSGSGGSVTNGGAVLNAQQQSLLDMARGMGYEVNADRAAQFAKHPAKQTDLNNKGDKP